MAEVIDRRLSFSGGEWSPWTDPRMDLEKYRTACRSLVNMRPTTYGGAFRRPGTFFMGAAKEADKRSRLVAFEFSVTTTLILEFGESYLRFWTTGSTAQQVEDPGSPGVPYEIVTPWLEQDLSALQFAQQNDIVYITHPDHPPHILSRFANDDWTLAPLVQEWPALRDENVTATTITASAATGSATLTSSSSIFRAGHVGSRWVIVHRRAEPKVTMKINSVSTGATTSPLFVLGDWSATTRTPGDGDGSWEVDLLVERSYDKVTWETLRTLTGTMSNIQHIVTGTEIDPCWLRLKLSFKSGSIPGQYRGEIEATDPNHYGIVDITGYTSGTSVTANIVFELGGTTATKRWREAAWSEFRGWPRSVAIHEQRLFFGGNVGQPQNVWGSILDDYANFRIGSEEDLGLNLTLAADKANGVQWMVSQKDLVIGTTGSEWLISAREQGKALSATNAAVRRSTNYGSDHRQAVAVNDATLFTQRNARKVREFLYAFETDGYNAQDLTLLAEHLGDSGIGNLVVQRNPETIVWAVTGAGELIGLCYERSQNVAGWFRYSCAAVTDRFESVAVVSSGGEEDEVWTVVRREVDGDIVRYVERFQTDLVRKLKDNERNALCYLDCAMVRSGSPTTIVTGLDHLEAREVEVLADGSPHPVRTVLGGEIELQFEASEVIVGLPYHSDLEPSFLETNDPGAVSKANRKRLHRATIELWRTLGLQVSGDGGATFDPVEFRTPGDLMDEAPPLFSGIIEQPIEASTGRQTSLILRQSQPLPFNVLSLHLRYTLTDV